MNGSFSMPRRAGSCVVFWCLLAGASPAIFAETAEPRDAANLVNRWLETSGIDHGVAIVLGCDDARILLALHRTGSFVIHAIDERPERVAELRKAVDAEGLYGRGIMVEQGELARLPFASNLVDLAIAPRLTASDLEGSLPSELLRVLRPRGVAVLGSVRSGDADAPLPAEEALRQSMKKAGAAAVAMAEDRLGRWAIATKPAAAGTDAWSHWEHGPDNNPVSTDARIQAPYLTQWLGEPYYIAMPAITTAAGGRIFIAMGHIAHHEREEPWLNTLLARNGYNGTQLWERKLPDGYLAHRSAFIATEDTFFMIDPSGSGCLLLDPETGEQRDRIHAPGLRGEWKWIALKDGRLFALVGPQKDPAQTTIVRSPYTHWSWGELSAGYYDKRIPWGFGRTLVAIDIAGRSVTWTHTEAESIDSRGIALRDDKLVFYAPDS
ncbi:MAG: class I SAM-dependent methyltransferase, partial [Planctomycetes bacterium]|nr:class I SAM-dependent methyltransferase [Planctomycetota bacterium]